MNTLLRISLSVALLGVAQSASAARLGRIKADEAQVYDSPYANHKVLGKVTQGAPIAASNNSRDGYYKVKTKSGIIGWLEEGAVEFKEAAPLATPKKRSQPSNSTKEYRVRVFGGADMFTLSDVNTLYGFDALKSGAYIGGEFAFSLSKEVALVFRLENISKSVIATDSATGTSFDIKASSMPFGLGLEYDLSRSSNFSIQIAGLVGYALSAKLISTATNLTGANVTTINSKGFSGLAKFNLTYYFSKSFSILGELGYRVQSGSKQVPDPAGNGSYIFRSGATSAGALQPVGLNFSGLIVGLGLGLTF